jgi:AcrR family transcriptional regulator
MANREQAKQQRRDEIVHAARTLMQKTGKTGFSMRTLADEAGVSIATPYNLFGSKQAVMFAVLDADLEQYQVRLERLRADEVDVFFKAVSLAAEFYATEPNFYRAVLLSVYNDGGSEFRSMFSGPRHAMWKRLVDNAIAAGVLSRDVDAAAFAVHLGNVLFSCILEWVHGQLSLDELEARGQYGFALALSGMSTPASSDRLRRRVISSQKRMRTLFRQLARASGQANGGKR